MRRSGPRSGAESRVLFLAGHPALDFLNTRMRSNGARVACGRLGAGRIHVVWSVERTRLGLLVPPPHTTPPPGGGAAPPSGATATRLPPTGSDAGLKAPEARRLTDHAFEPVREGRIDMTSGPLYLKQMEVFHGGARVSRFAMTAGLSDDPLSTFAFLAAEG